MVYLMNEDEVARAFSTVRVMVQTTRYESSRNWETVLKIPGQRLIDCTSSDAAVALMRSELVSVRVDHDLNRVWLLSIPPLTVDGFPIDLLHISRDKPIRCIFGLLEHDCETLDECFAWVTRALSSEYQLRTIYYGDDPREFYLEPVSGSPGDPIIGTGFGFFTRWSRKTVVKIRKNPLRSTCEEPRSGTI